MNKYHKIYNLWKRDERTKKYIPGNFFNGTLDATCLMDWIGTEKIDGMNIRVIWDGEKVRFGGKTDNAQLPSKLVEYLHDTFTIDKFAGLNPQTLYGEGFGDGIQKGCHYTGKGRQEFIIFDALLWREGADGTWMDRDYLNQIAVLFDIKVTPVVFVGNLLEMSGFVQKGFNSYIGEDGFSAEGVVARPKVEMFNRHGERLIVKIKTKDFPEGPVWIP